MDRRCELNGAGAAMAGMSCCASDDTIETAETDDGKPKEGIAAIGAPTWTVGIEGDEPMEGSVATAAISCAKDDAMGTTGMESGKPIEGMVAYGKIVSTEVHEIDERIGGSAKVVGMICCASEDMIELAGRDNSKLSGGKAAIDGTGLERLFSFCFAFFVAYLAAVSLYISGIWMPNPRSSIPSASRPSRRLSRSPFSLLLSSHRTWTILTIPRIQTRLSAAKLI